MAKTRIYAKLMGKYILFFAQKFTHTVFWFLHQVVKGAAGEAEVKEGVAWLEEQRVETEGEEEETWGMMMTTETWATG